MIGACSFLRRRPGDSLAHFETHWRDVHGPLAADLPGVARYLQGHIVRDGAATSRRALDLGIDGFAQQWFASETDRQACYDSGQEAVCDVDSLLFIGATARIVTDVRIRVPIAGRPEGRRILLYLEGDTPPAEADVASLSQTAGLAGLIEHRVVKQGAIPTTARDQVSIAPAAMIELYFSSVDAAAAPDTARFPLAHDFLCRNIHLI